MKLLLPLPIQEGSLEYAYDKYVWEADLIEVQELSEAFCSFCQAEHEDIFAGHLNDSDWK